MSDKAKIGWFTDAVQFDGRWVAIRWRKDFDGVELVTVNPDTKDEAMLISSGHQHRLGDQQRDLHVHH